MKKFTSVDKFVIEKRGSVYTLPSPEKTSTGELIGTKAVIDGKLCLIKGVETWGGRKEIEIGDQIGLLVDILE